MKHFDRERHGNQYLFKLHRTGETVAGVTENGHPVTFPGYTDGLSDDELLELIRETSITSKAMSTAKKRIAYVSSDGDIVYLIRLLPDKHDGNQFAEVELTQDHRWRGKRGDEVMWLWQDLKPFENRWLDR